MIRAPWACQKPPIQTPHSPDSYKIETRPTGPKAIAITAEPSERGDFVGPVYLLAGEIDILSPMSDLSGRAWARNHLPFITAALCVATSVGLGLSSGSGGLRLVGVPLSVIGAVGLLAWCPGRILVELLRIPGRRDRGLRTLLSVALSLSLSPVLLDGLWRWTHSAWILLGVWWLALSALSLWTWVRPSSGATSAESDSGLFERRATRFVVLALLAWISACVVISYWPERLGGAPIPATPHDYVKHHAILSWLHDGGLPLGNRFCADAAEEPYYYYHYFYLLPATMRLWSGGQLDIGFVFGITAALVAVGCVGLIYALTKRLTGGDGPAVFAAAVASLIGGLDVIPLALKGEFVVTLDAWADLPFRIHNFYTHFVWSPQHVLGLLILLIGVLLRSLCPRATWWPLLGALLCISLFGTTVYLAIPAFLALGICGVSELFDSRGGDSKRSATLRGYLILALLLVLLVAPQFSGYRAMSDRYEESISSDWPRNSLALTGRLVGPGVLANLLDLPWWLLLEFGVRFLACVLVGRQVYRNCWDDKGLRLLMTTSVCGLLLLASIRSGVHRFDYGFKIGALASMAFGAILCGCLLDPAPARARWWNPLGWRMRKEFGSVRRRMVSTVIPAAFLLGLPLGLYEAPITAVRRFVRPGETFAAEHNAWRFLRDELPPDAVIQTQPGRPRPLLAQLADRQWGVLDPTDSDVGVFRPRDGLLIAGALSAVRRAGQSADAKTARDLFRKHRVTHVFVGSIERDRWAHLDKFDDLGYFTPVYADDAVTVYALTPDDPMSRSEDDSN